MSKAANKLAAMKGTVNVLTPGTIGPAAPNVGQPQALLAATFDEPEVYSVTFNLTTSGLLDVPVNVAWDPTAGGVPQTSQYGTAGAAAKPGLLAIGVRPVATLNFKVQGVQVQRVFDIGSGVTISGVCDSIDCSVTDETSSVGGPGGVQYGISVQIARGVRASISQPPTLWGGAGVLLAAGGAGAVANIAVPQNCGINSVEVTAFDNTVPATLPVVRIQHVIGATGNKGYLLSEAPSDFVKIAPGTSSIMLQNFGADAVDYFLTWGIDG